MTKTEAVEILKKRVDIDKECLFDEDNMSDFDIFIKEQDDAIELAIEALQVQISSEEN